VTQFFRLLWVLAASIFRPTLGFQDSSQMDFRVMPGDLDINIHMNNARYLALMDLGRWDMILRGGLWRPILGQRLQPVIGAAMVRYRRPLKPFQPFRLVSRLLTWDEKWLYIEHRIESRGILACQAVVRAAFVGKNGVVPPAEVLGTALVPEALPWIGQWHEAEVGIEALPL